MIRFLLNLIASLIFRNGWRTPEFVIRPARLLLDAGLAMSTLFLGRQGAGKTMALAFELYELIRAHPEQSFVIFDWSGGLTVALFLLALSDPNGGPVIRRFVYDAMGGRDINGKTYIMPLPEFSESYDPEKPWLERAEDQIDRVQRTFEALYHEEISRNPTMIGRPIKSLLPNILLLANAVQDSNGHHWQMTEATKLLNKNIRDNAISSFGGKVGRAHEYFKKHFTGEEKFDQDLAQALADILDVVKYRRVRARLGYHTPGWTPNEAIKKGHVVICDGSGMVNNHRQKDYEYLRLFHLVLDEIDKRVPSAPHYHPFNWVMDEVYTFTEIPGVSRLLVHLPTEKRSRKVQLFLVGQSPKQFAGEQNGRKGLEDFVFSFGNLFIFSLLDIEDCIPASRNLFPFDPQAVKVPALTETQHAIMENRDEQVMRHAYQIQRLAHRECFVRRFITEEKMDSLIHVARTPEVRITASYEDVERLKDYLLQERGVELDRILEYINNRRISQRNRGKEPDPV